MIILPSSLFTNEEAIHPRIHAKLLDRRLGYRIPKIEEKLLKKFSAYDKYVEVSNRKQHYKGTEAWIGLHPQVLQTPYCDIFSALNKLSDLKLNHIVDIGAGYGRIGLILSVLRPESQFTGYEVVKQRQVEGNRIYDKFNTTNAKLILRNVLDEDFDLPEACVYFIYDFSDRNDVNIILRKLNKKTLIKPCFLITRGDRINYLMKNNFNKDWVLYSVIESTDLKIYKSKKAI